MGTGKTLVSTVNPETMRPENHTPLRPLQRTASLVRRSLVRTPSLNPSGALRCLLGDFLAALHSESWRAEELGRLLKMSFCQDCMTSYYGRYDPENPP